MGESTSQSTAGPVDISVVIPCRNGSPFIRRQLDALFAQRTGAEYEVIVADNGSTDDTVDIVRAYRDPRLRLVDASRAVGVNVGRNVGVGAAIGANILLTDADDVVQAGWLEAHWKAFSSGAQAVGGGLDCVLDDGEIIKRQRRLYRHQIGGIDFANGTNCGFTRQVFEVVGGFDESFKAGADEVDFFWRVATAGYVLSLVPDAIVSKRLYASLENTYRQEFNFGCGEARLYRKFRPGLLLPVAIIAMLQSLVWGTIRSMLMLISPRGHREATRKFAFSFGLFSEGVRLLSRQLGAWLVAARMGHAPPDRAGASPFDQYIRG